MQKFTELSEIELKTNHDVANFCSALQSLCHDLYMEVYFSATVLEQNLSTVRSENAKQKAKKIFAILEQAADAFKETGDLAFDAWHTFRMEFQSDIEGALENPEEPSFTFEA